MLHRLAHSPLYLMLIVTTVGAIGQLLLKTGMSGIEGKPSLVGIVRIMLTEPRVLFGLILFALNTILYLRVLQQYPLSLVYPMIAFSYVVVSLLSWMLLGERIPLLRVLGLLTIVAGVLLMALSGARERAREATLRTTPPLPHSAPSTDSPAGS
jgi:uncharacterized membrane protein